MPRSYSLNRRSLNLVDMLIPDGGLVSAYSVSASSTFNGTFTEFQKVPYRVGLRSASAKYGYQPDTSLSKYTRFLFSPSDYTSTVAAVDDSKFMWVKIAPVSASGVVGTYSAPTLLMPYNTVPNRLLVLNGTVGTSTVEIQLPCDFASPSVQVEGSNTLGVGFEPNGATFQVDGVTTGASPMSITTPVFNQLFLTGGASSVKFSLAARTVNSQVI